MGPFTILLIIKASLESLNELEQPDYHSLQPAAGACLVCYDIDAMLRYRDPAMINLIKLLISKQLAIV